MSSYDQNTRRRNAKPLNFEDVASLFSLPLNEAADRLGVCKSHLKKECRKLGLSRWPGRQLRKLDRKISDLHLTVQKNGSSTALADKISKLEGQRRGLFIDPTSGGLIHPSLMNPGAYGSWGGPSSLPASFMSDDEDDYEYDYDEQGASDSDEEMKLEDDAFGMEMDLNEAALVQGKEKLMDDASVARFLLDFHARPVVFGANRFVQSSSFNGFSL